MKSKEDHGEVEYFLNAVPIFDYAPNRFVVDGPTEMNNAHLAV